MTYSQLNRGEKLLVVFLDRQAMQQVPYYVLRMLVIVLTMLAAPFRINRTPRASIRARQSVSARNLKSALDKASLFSVSLNVKG